MIPGSSSLSFFLFISSSPFLFPLPIINNINFFSKRITKWKRSGKREREEEINKKEEREEEFGRKGMENLESNIKINGKRNKNNLNLINIKN